MGGDSTKRRFRPGQKARDSAAYPDVLTGRRAFLRRLGLLTAGALAAPMLVRCSNETAGIPSIPTLRINIDPDNPTLLVGEVQQFSAQDTSGRYQYDETLPANWTSSDPTVARIDASGSAEALAAGSTLIGAEYHNFADSTYLTVLDLRVQKLAIVPASLTLQINASKRIQALALLIGGGHHDLTDKAVWASSDPSVAAVQLDASGRCWVDARAAGKVTITATVSVPAPGFVASAELTVT